ncbi:MAG: hypothetical protein BIFFINMI_02791 [Phycisphaerae bacterium]|nr:hypothetical protein [Phycisphaerae bacterium]
MVLCLIFLLAAMAAPRYVSSLCAYRADLAAQRVAADLKMARGSAWSAGAHRTAAFTVASQSYVIEGQTDLNRSGGDYAVDLGDDPYHAQIDSADFEGASSVTFDGYGMPDRGGSIVIRVGDFRRTVTLDRASGNVSVQ